MSNLSQTYQKLSTSQKAQKQFSVIIRLIIAVLLIFFAIFPVLWIISASLDNSNSLATQSLIPQNMGFRNYGRLFNQDASFSFGDLFYWKWLFNSASKRFCNPPSPLTVFIISTTKSSSFNTGLNVETIPCLPSSRLGTSNVPGLPVDI